ncbi:MAG: DUF935 family protein, partial [Proteobacteria bacterium]|nr:DUF935 family protein [Pseudomonadota bacterium]
ELNGLAPCQVWRNIQEETDQKAQAEADKLVYDMGFALSEDAARAKYGEGWSRRGQAGAAPAAPQPALPVQPAASFAQALAPADPVAAATDALERAAAPEWQRVVDHLQALVDAADSADTVRAAIEQAYGALDTADLTRLLAAAFALAELKGLDAARAEAEHA